MEAMASADPRCRPPDEHGSVESGGVPIAWERYGSGAVTVVLMPCWAIVGSRVWKAQIAYLARHYRVVTFDGRGSGASGRPAGAAAYTDAAYVADTLAVMEATQTTSAVFVGFSAGAAWALTVAAQHPERVEGLFAIAPAGRLIVDGPGRATPDWDGPAPQRPQGWQTYNRAAWMAGGIDRFRENFFAEMFVEPHSTKQIEDAMLWSSAVTPEVLAATVDGPRGLRGGEAAPQDELATAVRCPVEVLHGTRDRIVPFAVGQRFAELTGGTLLRVEGSGHGLPGRDPVLVNTRLRAFVDRVRPPAAHGTWARASRRPRRVLYLSSPIGLGHACRDLAIARELRRLHPEVEIDWLTQPPVTGVLTEAGEKVHPASAWLASESAHIDAEAGEHDLHAFQAVRRMDEILVANYLVFDEVVRERPYDLVVGDEAWDVDHFLHENPERKRAPFAWFTDFVGWLPMPDGGAYEEALTRDYNAEMIEQRARYPHLRDRSIFVGDPEDVVDASFGDGLPSIRSWVEEEFDFAGYVSGFDVPDSAARAALRRSLGYRPEHRVCVVTVGGSGVGTALLERVLDAVPIARREVPELRFLVVCGPRIDPASLPRRRGVRIRGYVPRLREHLAACDVAVVQGGLTTCMELAAARTPFVYVPLRHHFEQNLHVRHRLERYRAGRHLAYEDAVDADRLAAELLGALASTPRPRRVATDGAARAAALLGDLL
ncbi:UNVERIFIED_CONTAM: alpha/beta hydrolase [Mumia flava]